MSVFKPFITSDVVVSPFKVNKTFTFEGTALLTGSGIDLFEGETQTHLYGFLVQTQPDIFQSKINF